MKLTVIDKTPPPPPKEYVLTLTQREADVLFALSGMIAGAPTGARTVTDSLRFVLAPHVKGVMAATFFRFVDVRTHDEWPEAYQ